MAELKCSACGITGIHACLGSPIVTNDLMLIQTLSNRIAELEGAVMEMYDELRDLASIYESDPMVKNARALANNYGPLFDEIYVKEQGND